MNDFFARLTLALCVALVAACSNSPTRTPETQSTATAMPAPNNSAAPELLSEAQTRLAMLPDTARAATTLQWAQAYLSAGRINDSRALIDSLSAEQLNAADHFLSLSLQSRLLLSEGRAQDAIALLASRHDNDEVFDAAQQAQLDLLHADALTLNGELSDSLRLRVAAHPLLDASQQPYNQQMIWNLLLALPSSSLDIALNGSQGDLRGWLLLASLYRDNSAELDSQFQKLNAWHQQWPTHPAASDVPAILNALQQASTERPSQVAFLLPNSGPLKNAGHAIRDGILAMYYRHQRDGLPPQLRFYDSATDDISALYQQAIADGADFVLGPLSKDKAAVLAALPTIPVPTILLNYVEQEEASATTATPTHLFQFGLSPTDEARQVAQRGIADGANLAAVLFPEGDWGLRVAEAFAQEWQSLGGTLVASRAFTDGPTMGNDVKTLLRIAKSEQRQRDVQRYTSLKVDAEPRRRQDIDLLFLVASANQGRQLKPALNFHYAKDIPVYATATIFGGKANPQRDQDLNGVRFIDMPWTLGSNDQDIAAEATQLWPSGHGRYERLFAMGMDAYRLQSRLALLRNLPGSEISGATGKLYLQQQRVNRELNWAIFIRGQAKPLPKVVTQYSRTTTQEPPIQHATSSQQ